MYQYFIEGMLNFDASCPLNRYSGKADYLRN